MKIKLIPLRLNELLESAVESSYPFTPSKSFQTGSEDKYNNGLGKKEKGDELNG
jgi:hypothetical protein